MSPILARLNEDNQIEATIAIPRASIKSMEITATGLHSYSLVEPQTSGDTFKVNHDLSARLDFRILTVDEETLAFPSITLPVFSTEEGFEESEVYENLSGRTNKKKVALSKVVEGLFDKYNGYLTRMEQQAEGGERPTSEAEDEAAEGEGSEGEGNDTDEAAPAIIEVTAEEIEQNVARLAKIGEMISNKTERTGEPMSLHEFIENASEANPNSVETAAALQAMKDKVQEVVDSIMG